MYIGAGRQAAAGEGRYDDKGRWRRASPPTVVRLEARHRPGTLACWDVWGIHVDGAERVHRARVTAVGALICARSANREIERRRAPAPKAVAAVAA